MFEYVCEARYQRGHTEEPTAVGLVIPITMRMLYVIEATRMMIVNSMVLVIVTNCMVGVGQAINGVLSRRERHGNRWYNKGKNGHGGDPDRHSKQRPSHQRREHAWPVLRPKPQT
jgi:hypothetical protein